MQIIIIIKWNMLFREVTKIKFFDGSGISDWWHVNTTENVMSPTDIFTSTWFDVC